MPLGWEIVEMGLISEEYGEMNGHIFYIMGCVCGKRCMRVYNRGRCGVVKYTLYSDSGELNLCVSAGA
jgi:hypothetical protein